MMRDEAPAATTRGVNKKGEYDRAEIGSGWGDRFNSQEAVRPASLLRKSILDVDRWASTTPAALQHSSCVPFRFGNNSLLNQ
jgi:hypothetical protein